MKKAILHTDGGARGNPGPAGIGVVLDIAEEKGVQRKTYKEYIGEATNNQAEYRAILRGLEEAQKLGVTHVTCYLDSELVVQQLKREYKVKDAILGTLFAKVWNVMQQLTHVTFTHIPREKNREADALVNEAIDAHVSR